MSLLLYKPLCIPCPIEGYRFLDPAEIICVESARNYSTFYCKNNVIHRAVRMKITEVSDNLPLALFYRVHRRFLVSRLHIVTMNKTKTRLFCTDGIIIHISDNYRQRFLGSL